MNTDSTWNAQSRYANGSHWISGSLFAHYDADLSKHIAFSAGSRINGISMYTPISFRGFNEDARLKFLAPSAEMGITYHKPSFKYFLNLSSGFRAPTLMTRARYLILSLVLSLFQTAIFEKNASTVQN